MRSPSDGEKLLLRCPTLYPLLMANAAQAPATPAAQSNDAEVQLPRTLGRLTLLKLIARGGMGEVFLAATGGIEGAERPVVVKLIRREHAKDPSFVARFLDEARVQAQLQHPGVAQIVEAAMGEDGQPFVAVEYIEGRSLAEVRARAIQMGVKVAWPEAVAIAASVAEALAHVHERVDPAGRALTIAHRDLSPQNVMVGFTGETKLIDFGTARGANRRSRTVAGVVYAKPGYVAPEVANGIPGDALVDVYALGVMLWELCAGRRFLQGEPGEHMAAVAQNRRPLPKLLTVCDAPEELDAILARMTAHEKSARSTAREAHSELVKLLAQAPETPGVERGVRARIAALLAPLYPSEPKRARVEFLKLLAQAKKALGEAGGVSAQKPAPQAPASKRSDDGMLPGTRYRIVGRVGEGSGGVVYEGVHVDLSRRVALKVLTPERASRSQDAARFRREAWALSRVAHRNLVKLYDFGVATDGRLFFAMEYLEGETLERFINREKSVPVAEALRVARETAHALDAAHRAGLVHRDIKPSNLFLTKDGGVKVLDFGVVCAPGDGSGDAEAATPSLALFGTPEYMAPEQIDGANIDGRADLYALGSVLYEMLTGRLPFAASSNVALLDIKRKQSPEAPSERAPSRKLSGELDELVMRAMARRPADRFSDAAEMRTVIERIERGANKGSSGRRALGFAAVAAMMVGALAMLGAGAGGDLTQHEAVQAAIAKVDPALRALRGSTATPEAPAAEPASEPQMPPLAKAEPVAPAEPAEVPAQDEAPAAEPTAKPAIAAEDLAEVELLKNKTEQAVAKKRWKVAKRYAEEWQKLDRSAEPTLMLAKVLSHAGKRGDAHELIASVLENEPASEAALALLKEVDGKRKATTHRSPSKSASAHNAHSTPAAKASPRATATGKTPAAHAKR